ncbi:hypothetical protein U5B43_04280 [Campylobacter sp. 9BO]|uniref:hypothetical protein n=1 Tax=Campylobacter sp. 9BO TaxID=3424759 RepID=UPI003D332981
MQSHLDKIFMSFCLIYSSSKSTKTLSTPYKLSSEILSKSITLTSSFELEILTSLLAQTITLSYLLSAKS